MSSDFYVPGVIHEAPDLELLRRAKQTIEEEFLGKGGLHTVAIGINSKGKQNTGEAAVVCSVSEKMKAQEITARGLKPIPPYVVIDGVKVLCDVVQEPPPRDLRLWHTAPASFQAKARNAHQACFNAPIPGGAQIAPQNAQWVGTLGCAVIYTNAKGEKRYGCITNAHVTGMNAEGKLMCQPDGRHPEYFGTVARVVDIHFNGGVNYIDAAVIDTERNDGAYAPKTHTVLPTQFQVGKLLPKPRNAKLGEGVIKSGRTTAVTRGSVIGIEGTSNVGYDEGGARFERQFIIKGNGRDFSAGGDSGSLIMSERLEPLCLLFAGGGGQTIACPILFVADWGKLEFFQT